MSHILLLLLLLVCLCFVFVLLLLLLLLLLFACLLFLCFCCCCCLLLFSSSFLHNLTILSFDASKPPYGCHQRENHSVIDTGVMLVAATLTGVSHAAELRPENPCLALTKGRLPTSETNRCVTERKWPYRLRTSIGAVNWERNEMKLLAAELEYEREEEREGRQKRQKERG